jgi:hypothetical protein
MLPTAVRQASQAQAAQRDARHDAAHMVAAPAAVDQVGLIVERRRRRALARRF